MKNKKLCITLLLFSFLCCFTFWKTDDVKAEEYTLVVNKGTCVTTVYKSDGSPYKAFICSPGVNTPEGTFHTMQKLEWHELLGKVYGHYCTRIVEQVLFHSVYYYTNGDPSTICTREYNYLGVKRSLGCIRLTVEDAKWVYENCGLGTTVKIINGTEKDDPLGKPASIRIDDSVRQGWDPTDPDPNNPYLKYAPTLKFSKSKKTTYQLGAKINYLSGVTAKNYDGKNYKSKVQIEGSVDTKKTGRQTVTYSVKSSYGLTVYKTFTYNIIDTKKPKITGAKKKSIEYLTTVNAKTSVKAKSSNGKNITSKIKITVKSPSGKKVSVKKGKFKAKEIGKYKITYKVKGLNKKTQTKTVTWTSVDKRVSLKQNITEVEYGSSLKLTSVVSLTSYAGKKLSVKKNTTIKGSVNTKKLGTYKITYTATQSKKASRKVKKTFKVKVVNKQTPILTGLPAANGAIKLSINDTEGSVYKLLDNIKASSATKVDLTSYITVQVEELSAEDNTVLSTEKKSELDLTRTGIYRVTYSVTVPVSGGLTTQRTILFNVE